MRHCWFFDCRLRRVCHVYRLRHHTCIYIGTNLPTICNYIPPFGRKLTRNDIFAVHVRINTLNYKAILSSCKLQKMSQHRIQNLAEYVVYCLKYLWFFLSKINNRLAVIINGAMKCNFVRKIGNQRSIWSPNSKYLS